MLPRKCMVVRSATKVKKWEQALGPEWYVIPVGAAICGRHFDVIALSPDWQEATSGDALEWFEKTLSHRLRDKQTGKIIQL